MTDRPVPRYTVSSVSSLRNKVGQYVLYSDYVKALVLVEQRERLVEAMQEAVNDCEEILRAPLTSLGERRAFKAISVKLKAALRSGKETP